VSFLERQWSSHLLAINSVLLALPPSFMQRGENTRGLREYRNRLNFIPENNLEYIKIIGRDYIS
jgi:hypothetical protein